MISAKVIADSKNEFGNRITTMVVTFPRIILAEFNTHRMFSRNSASSRAIPFEKMVKSVEENPFIPIAWQKDHKGMQGTEYITDPAIIRILEQKQRMAAEQACWDAESLNKEYSVTKQLCNRRLEPFMWHTVIVSATEWENFFALRCPKYALVNSSTLEKTYYRSKKDWCVAASKLGDKQFTVSDYDQVTWLKMNEGQAEIHMMALAEAMWDAMNESTPKVLGIGEWHIPFADTIDLQDWYNESKRPTAAFWNELEDYEKDSWNIKIATAKCARVSYTTVGSKNKSSHTADIELYNKLLESGHMSPFEHCAKAMDTQEYELSVNGKLEWTGGQYDKPLPTEGTEGWSGNFRGFIQYRKMFNNENITK